VELLLNPGSYLRLGENTQVILNKVELYDIEITVLQGSALVESNGFSKDLPLTVNSGKLKMEIIRDGIYLFSDGKAIVVDGKIRDASNGLMYGKGYAISNDQGGYRAGKVKTFTTALEQWSQYRDAMIASANASVARSLSNTSGLSASSFQNVWFWYDPFGSFIYLPAYGYRSPYGYSYGYVQTVYVRPPNSASNNNGNTSGGSNNRNTSSSSNTPINNSGGHRQPTFPSAGAHPGGAVAVARPAPASGGTSSSTGSSGGGASRPSGPLREVSK
jgi:hypothetical protein